MFSEENRKKIRKFYRDVFYREILDEDLDRLQEEMLRTMRDVYGAEASEEQVLREMKHPGLELYLSPRAIIEEGLRLLQRNGLDSFGGKYKDAGELMIAAQVVLALKKAGEGEFRIHKSESPDIHLVRKRKEFESLRFELLTIPQREAEKFPATPIDFERSVASFIRSKKFQKRYGENVMLVVHMDFTRAGNGFRLDVVKDALKDAPSPYNHVFAFLYTSPSALEDFTLRELIPGDRRIDIRLSVEQSLLF